MHLCLFVFPAELHATGRTEEHGRAPGRVLSDTDTKNMQVPAPLEGN